MNKISLALLCLTATIGAFAQTPPVVVVASPIPNDGILMEEAVANQPIRKVGDICTEASKDRGKTLPLRTGVISEVKDNTFVVSYTDAGGVQGSRKVHFTAAGNPFLTETPQGNFAITPFRPYFKYPLVKGTSWKGNYVVPRGTGGVTRVATVTTVMGWEEVDVPAGNSIRAIKIFVGGEYSEPGGSGKYDETVWYDPKSQCIAKYMMNSTDYNGNPLFSFTRELTAYMRVQ